MAVSPTLAASALATFAITSGGKPIDSSWSVISVDTWVLANKVPRARIVLFDGTAAEATFPISDQPAFLPGAKVEISAGYDGKNAVVFSGVVIRQGIEIDRFSGSKLVVELSDQALKMTLSRKSAVYEKIKDGDLIGKLISANGLAKDVAATSVVNEELVQYYVSDWDLMVTRAEANGLVVIVDAGKVTVKKPDTGKAAALTVSYDGSIYNLRAEMDATTQYASSAIMSSAWDSDTLKVVQAGPGPVDVAEVGNVTSAKLAQVFDVSPYPQLTGAMVDAASLKEWSSAELMKSKLSKIRGSVSFQGSSTIKAGGTLELAGVGTRFTGTVWVGGVHHCLNEGNWVTTCEFGLTAKWFAAETEVAAPDASGLLPPVKGLQTGLVKQVAKDPAGEYRVLVTLPLLNDTKGVWARLGTFYASDKVGAVFFPETGDEVVVGFMNDDPRYPVILASVYGKKHPPPYPPDDKNIKKALVTRSKLEMTFDDQDKVVEIKTPSGHAITLSDKAKSVTVKDANGNTMVMSKSGIAMESASNVSIKAKANVTIEAGANLKLSAKANADMEGLQVSHKAKAKFSAQGNAAAEVTASGMLTLRGALVKIN